MQYLFSLSSNVLALLGALVMLGCFHIQTAEAKNALVNAKSSSDSTLIAPSSSYTIAQITEASSPLYGEWKLTFSLNGIVYEGVLVMKGYSGGFGVRFFSPKLRKTQVVYQTMYLKSSSQGLILLGDQPSDSDYIPDNFIFALDPDGNFIAHTCDYLKRCSPVDVEPYK
jgi:hypothetical protein